MAVQFDLIIPPVIFGFIILLIFRMNSFMTTTSVDSRLIHEMQNFADASVDVIQDELKRASTIENITPEIIRFTNALADTITIFRNNRDLNIVRYSMATSQTDTTIIPARLSDLRFENNITNPSLVRVLVTTESTADQHAGVTENNRRMSAFSEKQILLRTTHFNQP